MSEISSHSAEERAEKVEQSGDERKPAAKRQYSSESGDNESKKVKREGKSSSSQTDGLSEVGIVPKTSPVASLPTLRDDDEVASFEEVEFLGATGSNPLTDFPHAREHCLVHPFQTDPNRHCENCFCYVCDKVRACSFGDLFK